MSGWGSLPEHKTSTWGPSAEYKAAVRAQWNPTASFRGDNPVEDLRADLKKVRKERERAFKEFKRREESILTRLAQLKPSDSEIGRWRDRVQEKQQVAAEQRQRDKMSAGTWNTTPGERKRHRQAMALEQPDPEWCEDDDKDFP